jgi:pectate lyase
MVANGGATITGGAPTTTGGALATGGDLATGGVLAAGGTSNTGGAAVGGSGATTGGTLATGGSAVETGGSPASGGAAASAGASGDNGADGADAPIGFAAIPGLGLETTTGGSGGPVVTATTFEELDPYMDNEESMIIIVDGVIDLGGMATLRSNKTLIGLDGARLINGGLEMYARQNIIIRNLNFVNTLGNSSDADGVVVQCYSHHVWIDHNTFHGVASGNDGAIDIKRGADWGTVSWNHIVAWDKSMLLGHVDDNGDQDRGTLHVTYHHNYFENTRQRHPRVRFGHAHIFNNYLYNDAIVANRTASYFIVAGVESSTHAEGNLIEHEKEIYIIGEESSSDADVTFTDTNVIVALNPNAESLYQIEPNGAAFDPATFYDYTPESAATIRTTVPQGAGAGRIE